MELNPEIWKEHPVYHGYYGNEDGEIWSILSNKKINGSVPPSSKYRKFRIKPNSGKNKYVTFQLFIYECFNYEINQKTHIISHKNGDLMDNKLKNLELLTREHFDINTGKIPVGEWEEHPIYIGYYGNKTGDVWSRTSGRKLECHINGNGYRVFLINNREIGIQNKRVQIHRIIYECFNGLLDIIYDIDHDDCDKLNNNLDNLVPLLRSDHALKTCKTRDNTMAINSLSKPVRRFKIGKNYERYDIKDYETLVYAEQDTGCRRSNICSVIREKQLTAGGYIWEYIKQPNLPGEIWKTINNKLFNKAKFSNMGRVETIFGVKTYGRLLPDGYLKIGINGKTYKVHTVICWAFHGQSPTDKHNSVDHKNKNKGDNRPENLKWATSIEQSNNSLSKAVVAFEIKTLKEIGRWISAAEAARNTSASRSRICHCINGTNNTCTSGGYIWRCQKAVDNKQKMLKLIK
jgi:hypothetical protein